MVYWFLGEDDIPMNPSPPPPPFVPLAERTVTLFDPSRLDASPGRRLRVFATLVHGINWQKGEVALRDTHIPFISLAEPLTYAEAMRLVEEDESLQAVKRVLSEMPLRIGYPRPLIESIPDPELWSPRDPDLPPCLQDLGDEINEDIREALDAFDNGSCWYPGIDEGIEPVTDDHVRLVIWALQRELNRELRPQNGRYGTPPLPAAPLEKLPWPVQRALVERRRWRYRQFGIGHDEWQRGNWSLWEVPLDPDWVPRRQQRYIAEAGR